MGFSSSHLELIRNTPLGPFIDMQLFIIDGSFLSDIIRCHVGEDRFIIIEKLISFSIEEAVLILGLSCHNIKTSPSNKKRRLVERFGGSLDLYHKGLERKIKILKDFKEKDIEDTLRL